MEKEQQAVAERLYEAVADGHLGLEDFSDRIGAAYAAASAAELGALVADLPTSGGAETSGGVGGSGGAAVSAVSGGSTSVSVVPADPVVVVNPIGAVKRGGQWRLDEDTELRTVLGTVKLDLYGVQLARPEVTLSARTTVGTIKVWVPPGLRVVVEGRSIVGGRYVEENHLPPEVPAPTLRLRLDTVLGTVKVYRG